jgi:hypothetical protein
MRAPLIAVCGPGERVPPGILDLAEALGRELAGRGAVLLSGGLGGAMEAAARGARGAGGLVIGLLPGTSPADANPWVDIALPTGLGAARNILVATAAEVVIAVGGRLGTLTEVAFALRVGRPVISLHSFRLEEDSLGPGSPLLFAATAEEAATRAIALARPPPISPPA